MKHVRDEKRKLGIHRFLKSFTYSFAGLKYAFRYEQNMLVHLLATIVVISAGFFFKLQVEEWVILFMAIGLVIGAELLNTAIEATVDLATPSIQPLAKVAKDTASAAVFIFAMTALITGLLLFVPKFCGLF